MHNGVCVAENTFLQAIELRVKGNGLHCLLASNDNVVTSAQVNWLYPGGNPLNCSEEVEAQNDIGCSNETNNNGSILYISRLIFGWPPEYSGLYTCCLPGNCSLGSRYRITVWIFSQSSLHQ